jgi:hypothetical protein
MTIDTSRRLEFHGSRGKLLGLALLGAGMTALSLWIVAGGLAPAGSLAELAGYAGALFFGAATLVGCYRLATANRVMLTIAPEGIRDVRVADAFIPWTSVRSLSTWSMQGQQVLVVEVDPETEKNLPLTRLARWSRGANKSLGADGLCISPAGLGLSYDELLGLATQYAQTHAAQSR